MGFLISAFVTGAIVVLASSIFRSDGDPEFTEDGKQRLRDRLERMKALTEEESSPAKPERVDEQSK